jgi:hypothetical protein
VLDGVEIRGIGREIGQSTANFLDYFLDAWGFVKRSVVHDDHLSRVQFRTKLLLEPGAKQVGIGVTAEIKRSDNFTATKASDDAGSPVRFRPAPFPDDFDSPFRPSTFSDFSVIYSQLI